MKSIGIDCEGGNKVSINEKIQKANAYVLRLDGIVCAEQLRNDAANIFADSYEEYMAIWDALQKG